MSVHERLDDVRKWVNVDVSNTTIRDRMFDMIKQDQEKDSPSIVEGISEGKYSPFKKYLSKMGQSQLYCMKVDKMLGSSMMTALAVVKFKRLGKRNIDSKISA